VDRSRLETVVTFVMVAHFLSSSLDCSGRRAWLLNTTATQFRIEAQASTARTARLESYRRRRSLHTTPDPREPPPSANLSDDAVSTRKGAHRIAQRRALFLVKTREISGILDHTCCAGMPIRIQ